MKKITNLVTLNRLYKIFSFVDDKLICVCGINVDLYIYYAGAKHSAYSGWIKGLEAIEFWNQCLKIKDKKKLAQKLLDKFNSRISL